MKYIFLVITLVLHYVIVVALKLIDQLAPIIGMLGLSLIFGAVLKAMKSRRAVSNIGWGLFYGSLISVAFLIGFIVWLYIGFSK